MYVWTYGDLFESARSGHSRSVALVCEGRNSCFVNDRVQRRSEGPNTIV